MYGVGLGEPAQDRLGRDGAGVDRGRVLDHLDHLVVLLRDQLPPDRPVHHRGRQPRVRSLLASRRPAQPDRVDPLDPGQQLEAERPDKAARGKPQRAAEVLGDLGRDVLVDVVAAVVTEGAGLGSYMGTPVR